MTFKGKKHSEETKIKMSEAKKGKKRSEETKRKMSVGQSGRKHSEETKRKMSEIHKNYKHSEKTKQKISISHRKENLTNENLQNYSNANKGRIFSEETKKKISESQIGLHSGDKNPAWIDGRSFLPYCKDFNEIRKEKVRERDGRVCQECGKTEQENGKKLTCHHIHYDKKNCKPDLIALCVSCNSKANINKDYWEEHFMKKLSNRGLI